jgi:hypothetical protein
MLCFPREDQSLTSRAVFFLSVQDFLVPIRSISLSILFLEYLILLDPYPNIFLLYLSMSCESTYSLWVSLSHYFFCYSDSLCLANHISVIVIYILCCLTCRFCLLTRLFIYFYLGHFVILVFFIALVTILFIISLLDHGHYFIVIIYLIIISYHITICHLG